MFAFKYTVALAPETVLRYTSPSGVILIWQSPLVDKKVKFCEGAYVLLKLQYLTYDPVILMSPLFISQLHISSLILSVNGE